MNAVEPHLEKWFIDDTFACRKGKGVHACLDRAGYFARRQEWFLKLDIRKYFDSIDHSILLSLLERRFKDPRLHALFVRLLGGYYVSLGKVLPIGSLTSQHLANFYLGWLDRFVKEKLRCRGYVRYMDDIVVWKDRNDEATWALDEIRLYLSQQLQLSLRPEPYINQTRHGMNILDCRIFRTHRILNRVSRVRLRRKLLQLDELLREAKINESHYQRRANSLMEQATAGKVRSWRYRTCLLSSQKLGDREAPPG